MKDINEYHLFEVAFSTNKLFYDEMVKRVCQRHKVLVAASSFGDVEVLLEKYCKNMEYFDHSIRIIKRLICGIDIENNTGDVWKLTSRFISNNRCVQKYDFYVRSSNIDEYKVKFEKRIGDDKYQVVCSAVMSEYEDILCRGYGVLKEVLEIEDNEDSA